MIKFKLTFSKHVIGTLTTDEKIWYFEYDAQFSLSKLRPLIEFPEIGRIYKSKELWAFFETRIPSRKQIQSILKREKISETDLVTLLKRFGKKVIANPFELEEYV